MKSGNGNFQALAIALLAMGAAGCSLKQGESARVTISVPQGFMSKVTLGGGHGSMAMTETEVKAWLDSLSDPTSLDEFHCFALNVTAGDIPNHPDIENECSSEQPGPRPGVIAGLVPASGGSIDVAVPAGAGRTFQLLGIRTADGRCPLIRDVVGERVDEFGVRLGKKLDRVYQIGMARADVFTDMSVEIRADIAQIDQPVCFGQDKDGPGGNPPSAAYSGVITMGTPPVYPDPMYTNFGVIPETGLDAPTEFFGAVSFASALLDLLSIFEEALPNSPPAYNPSGALSYSPAYSATQNQRAAIQLQWRIPSEEISAKPYFQMHLSFTGGADGAECESPGSGRTGAVAGLFRSSGFDVMQGRPHDYDPASLGHSSFYGKLSDHLISKPGGPMLIANVESIYISTMESNCLPWVAVDGAKIHLSANPKPLSLYYNGTELTAAVNGQIYLRAEGGVGPYSFQLNDANLGSFSTLYDDGVTQFDAGSTPGSGIITVGDSDGTFIQVPITITP